MEWLENIDNLTSRKDDQNGLVGVSSEPETNDTTSSVAKANAERDKQRDMEERLKAFKQLQEKADKDGEFTKEDKQAAEDQFKQDEASRSEADKPASMADLQKQINDLKVILESQQRLVPEGGLDKEVLTKDGARVVWGNILALFFKIPANATDNLYFCLKGPECPSLVVDDAVVLVTANDGSPLWYGQFDYWRPALTPVDEADE